VCSNGRKTRNNYKVDVFSRKAFCGPKIGHYEERGKIKLFVVEKCT
jgi:hypothetical protein